MHSSDRSPEHGAPLPEMELPKAEAEAELPQPSGENGEPVYPRRKTPRDILNMKSLDIENRSAHNDKLAIWGFDVQLKTSGYSGARQAGASKQQAGPSEPSADPSEPQAGASESQASPSQPQIGPSEPHTGPSQPQVGPSGPQVGPSVPKAAISFQTRIQNSMTQFPPYPDSYRNRSTAAHVAAHAIGYVFRVLGEYIASTGTLLLLFMAAIVGLFRNYPRSSTFVLFQFICSAVPISIFLASMTVAATIAAVIFTFFAAFILVPVLLFTGTLGLSLWISAWLACRTSRWIFRTFSSSRPIEDGTRID